MGWPRSRRPNPRPRLRWRQIARHSRHLAGRRWLPIHRGSGSSGRRRMRSPARRQRRFAPAIRPALAQPQTELQLPKVPERDRQTRTWRVCHPAPRRGWRCCRGSAWHRGGRRCGCQKPGRLGGLRRASSSSRGRCPRTSTAPAGRHSRPRAPPARPRFPPATAAARNPAPRAPAPGAGPSRSAPAAHGGAVVLA